jgi:sec-independent protein translocase protein TatA
MDIGPSELIIILAIVLLLFGGSRLAGLGKSAGRALKEFKDETTSLSANPTKTSGPATPATTTAATTSPEPTAAEAPSRPAATPSDPA